MTTNNTPAQRQQDPIVVALNQGGSAAIARALGDPKKAERFARVALTTIRKSPQLAKCDPKSVMAALMHCASFDMEPDARGLVWLVPYKAECQFQLGYKGMIELAMRSGMVNAIYADVVYEAEAEAGLFFYQGGTDRKIIHNRDVTKPDLRKGNVIGAYAVAEMSNGTKISEFVDRAYLDKRKNSSQAGGSQYSPWQKWYEEMAKKTAVKALCRTLPQSVEKLHHAIAIESEYEARAIEAEQGTMNAASLQAKLMGSHTEETDDQTDTTEIQEATDLVACPASGKMEPSADCAKCKEECGSRGADYAKDAAA